MLEITRELVEHYLRATGWIIADGEWRNVADPAHYDRFPASWIGDVGLDIDVVIRMTGHSDNLASLAFRLGLCAAADKLISSAHATEKMNTPPDDILFALVGEDRMQAHELLRLAGVDPIAWESARKR